MDKTIEYYERLCQLHHKDPRQFEEERLRLIRDTIESFDCKHRRKAYGLQYRIDSQLRRYSDPVMRMNKMVEIFWEGVHDFREVMSDPGGYLNRRRNHAAKILPFQRRGKILET
jgi:hypothetical protein